MWKWSILAISGGTHINALAKAGFVIEQMNEETGNEIIQLHDEHHDFVKRAKMFPVTFVIKARKL